MVQANTRESVPDRDGDQRTGFAGRGENAHVVSGEKTKDPIFKPLRVEFPGRHRVSKPQVCHRHRVILAWSDPLDIALAGQTKNPLGSGTSSGVHVRWNVRANSRRPTVRVEIDVSSEPDVLFASSGP